MSIVVPYHRPAPTPRAPAEAPSPVMLAMAAANLHAKGQLFEQPKAPADEPR